MAAGMTPVGGPPSPAPTGLGYRRQHLLYIPVTALSCLVAAAVAHLGFGLDYSLGAVAATALALAPLFVLLGPALRGLASGTVLALAVSHLLMLGHAVKLATLKEPIYASDLQSIPLLINVLSGRYLLIGAVVGLGALLLPLACLRPRNAQWIACLLACAYALAFVMTSPRWIVPAVTFLGAPPGPLGRMAGLDEAGRRDEQLQRLQRQGAVLYLLNDWQAMQRDIGFVPDRDEVAAVGIQPWRPASRPPARNVHIVLLESIWDTSVLDGVSIQGPQLDPRFVALWEQAGRPHALSPVAGGRTANAEFEALCGFPAPDKSIAFVGGLHKPMPCLPGLFQDMGYVTMASHPNIASSWGRDEAYGLLGFSRFYAVDAFDLDDMDGPFLADGSLLRQNLERLHAHKGGAPVFNYVVSLSSHWGYPRDKQRRPDLVSVSPPTMPVLSAYANGSAYTTKALMDWTERVLAEDPDALIVAFGDHCPVLDVKPDPYAHIAPQPGRRYPSPEIKRMVEMARVPLLVIDGKRGPVAVPDDLPLFRLPQVIAAQLKLSDHVLPQSRPASDTVIARPVRGGQLLSKVDGRWLLCGTNDARVDTTDCRRAWHLHQQDRVLRQDLMVGRGYSLAIGGGAEITQRLASLDIVHDRCAFTVRRWGPQQAKAGEPFSPTRTGESGLWISFISLGGRPQVLAGDTPLVTVHGDRLVTATVPGRLLQPAGGTLPVALQCPGEDPVLVGNITFH